MFNIPDAAVPFITLQRTDVRKTVQGFYRAEINRDYAEIKAYLPKHCTEVLDIGAGMAGIDVMLHQHYDNVVTFHLLDKTEVSPERETPALYGFHEATRYYSSLEVAADLLHQNGVPASHVQLYDVIENTRGADACIDLVISLLAWGYHFPLETYLDDVIRLLKPGGVLILDLRLNRQQDVALLQTRLNSQPVCVGQDHKRQRLVFWKRDA